MDEEDDDVLLRSVPGSAQLDEKESTIMDEKEFIKEAPPSDDERFSPSKRRKTDYSDAKHSDTRGPMSPSKNIKKLVHEVKLVKAAVDSDDEDEKRLKVTGDDQQYSPPDSQTTEYRIETLQNVEDLIKLDDLKEDNENSLTHFFANMPPSAYNVFWSSLYHVTKGYFTPPINYEDDWDAKNAEVVLWVSALVVRFNEVAIDWAEVQEFPKQYIAVADLLREVCLHVSDKTTSANILHALERLCSTNLNMRRLKRFYGTMSLNLVNRTLDDAATNADVARIYRLRHMLDFIDWTDNGSLMMRGQLARCFMKPIFLQDAKGINFLAHLHLVHASFPMEIYEVMANWVPHVKQSQNRTYSQILFKAWNKSTGPTREQMETVIQKWMMSAIFLIPKEAAKIRHVLNEFHHKRHSEGVSTMLAHCYAPILWRNLHVANWKVRYNCVSLLMSSFPLASSNLNVEQYEQEMDKSYKAIQGALLDQKEEVRKCALTGTARVMTTYWEMIPVEQNAELFLSIINHCARDKNSPSVRIAACDGMRFILGNPLSHETLKLLLPRLAHLLHDKAPTVRNSFVKLLEAIHKEGCQMSTTDVLKHDELLLRLAAEYNECMSVPLENKASSALGKRLANLLISGFMEHEIGDQLARTVNACQEKPLPFIALLTFADINVSSAARLAAAMFQCCLRNDVHPIWPIIVSILLSKSLGKSKDVDLFLQRNITDEAFAKLIVQNPDLAEEFSQIAIEIQPEHFPESTKNLMASEKLTTSNQLLILCAKADGFEKFIKPIIDGMLNDVCDRLSGTEGGEVSLEHNRLCRRLLNLSEMREQMLKDKNLKAQLENVCFRCVDAVVAGRSFDLSVARFIGFAVHMLVHWNLTQGDEQARRRQIDLASAFSKLDSHLEVSPSLRHLGIELMETLSIVHAKESISSYYDLIRAIGERVWDWSGDDETKCQTWAVLARIWAKQVGTSHEIFENLGLLFRRVRDSYPKDDAMKNLFWSVLVRFQNSHLLESFFEMHRKDSDFIWHSRITSIIVDVAIRFPTVRDYLQNYGIMARSEKPAKKIFDANRIFIDKDNDDAPIDDDPMEIDNPEPSPGSKRDMAEEPTQKVVGE